MKTLSFAEKFLPAEQDTKVHLTGYDGVTPAGDHIISAEKRDRDGKVLGTAKLLYFRNKDVRDIQVNEDGTLAEGFIISTNGAWITTKGAGIDTTGFGEWK